MVPLAIIFKVGFEYVLNIYRVNSVNLTSERGAQPVSLIFPSKISHVMMHPVEVEKLGKHRACNWMVLVFFLLFVQFSKEELDYEYR